MQPERAPRVSTMCTTSRLMGKKCAMPAVVLPRDPHQAITVQSLQPSKILSLSQQQDPQKEGLHLQKPPCAGTYDVDMEHAYIMSRALSSYREHYLQDKRLHKRHRQTRTATKRNRRQSEPDSSTQEQITLLIPRTGPYLRNFQSLEAVDRGSDPQLQVTENLNDAPTLTKSSTENVLPQTPSNYPVSPTTSINTSSDNLLLPAPSRTDVLKTPRETNSNSREAITASRVSLNSQERAGIRKPLATSATPLYYTDTDNNRSGSPDDAEAGSLILPPDTGQQPVTAIRMRFPASRPSSPIRVRIQSAKARSTPITSNQSHVSDFLVSSSLYSQAAVDVIREVGRANTASPNQSFAERRFLHAHSIAVDVPMDKLATKKEPDKRRKPKAVTPCFSAVGSPKRQYFTIHPEWVSENLSVQRLSLQQRTATYPPRRCRSAPPVRSRNPITWENF